VNHCGRTCNVALLMLIVFLAGCATYKVTSPLERPIGTSGNWYIGEIRDALPADTEPEDRPDEFAITKLKGHLKTELEKKHLYQTGGQTPADDLEIRGNILEYKKGSGFLRFLFGAFAGGAVLTTELQLCQRQGGEVLFAGNFSQRVSSWAESGDEMFKRIAKDFAKALEKNNKKALQGS